MERNRREGVNSLFHDPVFSPWGSIQTCQMLCPGVFEVSTAGHGGIMATRGTVSKIFSEAAQSCGFWERGYLCFEEDCDAQVALRELMDRGLFAAPVNQHFGPGEYSACINEIIQLYHPDYWKAHEDGLTQTPKQIKTKEYER